MIALREGVEASLIVGIIAAFLSQQGRRDALRAVWAGVALAAVVCMSIAVGLQVLDRSLPERGQEQLETLVALVAVAMVTFMIAWMRRHGRTLAGDLRADAATALAAGSAAALVAMAFFAVLREGIETSVFLLAAFQESGDAAAGAAGAVTGLVAAAAVGVAIFAGGVRLDLARFFRATGLVLVLVAAGLVAAATHTAHEAGWLDAGQAQALDLTWLVRPDQWSSALITGMLGIQPQPVVAEVVAWLLYAVPVACYVVWPSRRRPRARRDAPAVAA